MGRLFLRLFVGIMLLQFGLREMCDFSSLKDSFPAILGMSSESALSLMIAIDVVCSIFIMVGFCTRIMCIPPFLAMGVAEYYLLNLSSTPAYDLTWDQLGYLPIMFMGIYFFIALVGPGKLSVDYFLSLHIIHTENADEDQELEQV